MRTGFSSRFGLIVATLGMAVGTGNLWRFPRIAARYEGGAFLIPWAIFLVTWSIPIMIAEFSLGKTTRRGVVGAFARLVGPQAAWMGGFIGLTTLLIASYYSVVTGWTLRYLVDSLDGFEGLTSGTTPEAVAANRDAAVGLFENFAGTPMALVFHLICVVLGVLVIWRGVRSGVERACKILIPLLFLLLLGGAIWALTLPEAVNGLNYFFHPDWSQLRQPNIWIDGLSQSAWSTGAGWGLLLTYGAYARRNEDAVTTNLTAGFGNNLAALLAGLFIFPAVFALLGAAGMGAAEISGALKSSGTLDTGLAFQYIPFIFKGLPQGGQVCTTLFFLALFFAAFSSLIAMYEMGTRALQDMGVSRQRAALAIGIACASVGSAAALDNDVFVSLDWVWGLGLVLGGVFIVWAVQLRGIDAFRREIVDGPGCRVRLGWTYNWILLLLVPAEAAFMLGWWLWHAAADPDYSGGKDPWDPFALGTYNAGTCVVWWGVALALLILFSPWLGRRALSGPDTDQERP